MTPVREFHKKFDQRVADTPGLPECLNEALDLVKLRKRLIREEYEEVNDEFSRLLSQIRMDASKTDIHETLVRLLKELADLRYVLEGTAVSLGLPIDEAFEEVHRSNMTKVWSDGSVKRDAGGKVLKPPTYEQADVAGLMDWVDSVAFDD